LGNARGLIPRAGKGGTNEEARILPEETHLRWLHAVGTAKGSNAAISAFDMGDGAADAAEEPTNPCWAHTTPSNDAPKTLTTGSANRMNPGFFRKNEIITFPLR
jgi:hypothetical protein